jgi:hypothetical protein
VRWVRVAWGVWMGGTVLRQACRRMGRGRTLALHRYLVVAGPPAPWLCSSSSLLLCAVAEPFVCHPLLSLPHSHLSSLFHPPPLPPTRCVSPTSSTWHWRTWPGWQRCPLWWTQVSEGRQAGADAWGGMQAGWGQRAGEQRVPIPAPLHHIVPPRPRHRHRRRRHNPKPKKTTINIKKKKTPPNKKQKRKEE